MKHKMDSMNWGKARCGATNVSFARSWKDVDCEECHETRNQMKYTKMLTPNDDDYVGSLQEKIDYDCEQDMIYEANGREEMQDDSPTLWERNQ